MLVRALRITLWVVTSLLFVLALVVTGLRIALPHMSHFQNEITAWVNQQTQIDISIENVQGYWRNTHPSLSLKGLKAQNLDGNQLNLAASRVDIEFDLIRSVLRGQLVVADLTIHQLGLDARSISLHPKAESSVEQLSDQGNSQTPSSTLLATLDRLFLRQLDYFSILDSQVLYRSITGEVHSLEVETLRWVNQGKRHLAEGRVSILGTGVNLLKVGADFVDFGSFLDLSGQFYLKADQIELGQWLNDYLKQDVGLDDGQLSFDAWIELEHNALVSNYLSFRPSFIKWDNQHQLSLTSGVVESVAQVENERRSWLISTHDVALSVDEVPWSSLNLTARWAPDEWQAEVDQIDIAGLRPLVDMIPHSESMKTWLDALQPQGNVNDLRVAKKTAQPLRYSGEIAPLSLQQWQLLPEVHHLIASFSGTEERAVIRAELKDDELPYGDVFQAPLLIHQGAATLVWQKDDAGWSLWSDHVSVATPHMAAQGEFRLDFPQGSSPHLAIYSEVDLEQVGETWRYLPTRALGHGLTDYLSTALQGGSVQGAQILWYGSLRNFPYAAHQGIFQAAVPLKQGKFSFDTHWPSIDDLQLDLLFQNDALTFESHSAQLMDVNASHILGNIPHLIHSGHLDIQAVASGDGTAVRDYMTSSPLVDSVGAALTTVGVNGNVDANFKLHIPFDLVNEQVRAWGEAKLKNNRVELQAPPMSITQLSGLVRFDNDRIDAKGISGRLLGQKIQVGFHGQSNDSGYGLHIDTKGMWEVSKLAPYVGRRWIAPLKGDGPWKLGVDVQLRDTGFSYTGDLQGDLTRIASQYPYPLNKQIGDLGELSVQVSGNQQSLSARAELPKVKYQTDIDISQPTPVLTATRLALGAGSFRPSPITGHQVSIRSDVFNLDDWVSLIFSDDSSAEKTTQSKASSIVIPVPQDITLEVPILTAATLDWHDVEIRARQQNVGWKVDIQSQEARGEASYLAPYDLTVALKQLHLYVPQLEENGEEHDLQTDAVTRKTVTEFDRSFHQFMPNLTLFIDDFWLQGYKVGQVNMDFQRHGDRLEWKSIDITSGSSEIHAQGDWRLNGEDSHTTVSMQMKGDNNSDLMERFGVTSGIQKAPFSLSSQLDWEGAPWSAQVDTLNGSLDMKLGKGVVSDMSGAAKLVGLFSLDSIIRKMQLDFSDVFDSGMAFDSIEGRGEISDGIFVTNNITMDAMAGDMTIKGLVDLNQRLIDSEVSFVPDVTSGIPVLSAFAVTPVTALYVLAITTVISPVVEIFTEINYSVKGSMDAPMVKEISRTKGEFTLPEKLLKEVERQGKQKQ